MGRQTMLQLQAKTDSRLTADSGLVFGIAKGDAMLLGLVRDRKRTLVKVVTGDTRSQILKVDVTDLYYRHQDDSVVIEGAEFPVLSDKPTRLEFETLLGHVKFHERLVRQTHFGQVL